MDSVHYYILFIMTVGDFSPRKWPNITTVDGFFFYYYIYLCYQCLLYVGRKIISSCKYLLLYDILDSIYKYRQVLKINTIILFYILPSHVTVIAKTYLLLLLFVFLCLSVHNIWVFKTRFANVFLRVCLIQNTHITYSVTKQSTVYVCDVNCSTTISGRVFPRCAVHVSDHTGTTRVVKCTYATL